MNQLTFWSEGPHASHSASPDSAAASPINEETSPSSSADLSTGWSLAGSYGKTSSVFCHLTADGTLAPSSGRFLKAGMGWLGEFSMRNFSECPSDAVASSLSDILEDCQGGGASAKAAQVLFDSDGVCRHPHARQAARQIVAALTANGVGVGGPDAAHALAGHLIAHTLRGEGFDASEDGTGRGTPLVPIAFSMRGRDGQNVPEPEEEGLSPALRAVAGGSSHTFVATHAVRRITPREAERLQGFPDDWTLVPYRGREAADGPRYKAIGNSMAVPVMAWIGRRIMAAE